MNLPGVRTYSHNPFTPDGLADNAIRALWEDRDGKLWVGTNGSGLDLLDPKTGKARHFRADPANPKALSGLAVIALTEDKAGNLWVGTYDGGLNRLDKQTGSFTRFGHLASDSNTIADNRVLTLLPGPSGSIWVGTYEDGLDQFIPQTGRFRHFRHNPKDPFSISSNAVRHIYQDRSGTIWVGTSGGLNRFDPGTGKFYRFTHDPKNPASLSSNRIRCLGEDAQGSLWIGTIDGGINRFNPKTGKSIHYTAKDGLPGDEVFGILGDDNGFLWISTDKGLARFSPENKQFKVFNESDGLPGDEFSFGGYHKGRSGKLYFGGFKGLSIFNPDSIQATFPHPKVVLTELKIADRPRTILLRDSLIRLSHTDNSIAFEFAALQFEKPEQIRYEYQLKDVDRGWVQSGSRRYASYANLKGGKYQFQVRAISYEGQKSAVTALSIDIKPPYWETWWFKLLMVSTVLILAFALYQIRVNSIKQNNLRLEALVKERTEALRQQSLQLAQSLEEIRLQQQEADRQRTRAEEANRVKTELTNITVHDLKNPLGGVLLYADLIKESVGNPEKTTQLAQTIKDTAKGMLHLVSNLLKRAKLESSFISLQKEEVDVTLLVRAAVSRNTPLALHKEQLLLLLGETACYARVDLDLMNDVFENLISNAIKFSPPRKVIRLNVARIAAQINISVIDEGQGIKPEEKQHLFKPFQRLSATPTGGESSTGLGLSLVKRIVELHGGAITAQSAGPGKGSTFTITIPAAEPNAAQQAEAIPNQSVHALKHT